MTDLLAVTLKCPMCDDEDVEKIPPPEKVLIAIFSPLLTGCNRHSQGARKSLAALALLGDKLKYHGQILTWLCMENVGKGI